MAEFTEIVKEVVRNIKKGTVMTYQEVAVASGRPSSARAVATIMAKNYDLTVPCHRVIRSDGTLGGYNRGGVVVKRRLLEDEGVVL